MEKENGFYSLSKYGHEDGENRIKLDFSVYVYPERSNIAELVCQPIEELEKQRTESQTAAKAALQSIELSAAEEWAKQAGQAILLKKALEYVRTAPVKHTSNVWKETENSGHFEISNMVYKMTYHIYDRTVYDKAQQKSIPVAWYVNWSVSFNVPREYYYHHSSGADIADQRDKRYTDKAAAYKYLQGRIAAYAHLFTELSPPIPEEKRKLFSINGLLLPGYTVAAHEPTPDELLDLLDEGDFPGASTIEKVEEKPAPSHGQKKTSAPKRGHSR